jgi:transcriptional regulator with XRE-family HTH domain
MLRRKALDQTREELARRSGCSVHALRKIESGERRPSKQLAGLLAT